MIHYLLQQLGVVMFAFLHAVPAIGVFVVTSMQLAFVVKSPTVAISIIILCFFPTMIVFFHYFYVTIIIRASVPSAGILEPTGTMLAPELQNAS